MALAPGLSGRGGVHLPFQRLSSVHLQLQPVHHRSNPKPYTSFFIKDILGSKIGSIERDNDTISCPLSPTSSSPWSLQTNTAVSGATQPPTPRKDVGFPVSDSEKTSTAPSGIVKKDANGSPLSALEELANKTFTGLETSILRAAEAATVNGKRDPLHLFNRQPPRKKRKSRTAFSNQQIFELERRFIYQKYLTPADRDEIASVLGLSNAQVITWFQNRRAKLKRDMEELTMDVTVSSKKCGDINLPAETDVVMTSFTPGGAATAAKTAREVEDEDEEDRLSTVCEQNQCREQYALRLASSDNSQNCGLPGDANTNADGRPGTGEGGPPDAQLASPVSRDRNAGFSAVQNPVTAPIVEEVESMDCSTSPSSGFHSDSEDK